MAIYKISLLRYFFEVFGSLKPGADDRVLDANGSASSMLKMFDHVHRSHLHSKNHKASECYPTDSTAWGDLSEGTPSKAGMLIQEFMGNQDLDEDSRIYGKDFKITDDDDKPPMLKTIELQPDWEDPDDEMTWPDYLASMQPDDLPFVPGDDIPGLPDPSAIYPDGELYDSPSGGGGICGTVSSPSTGGGTSSTGTPKDADAREEFALEHNYLYDSEKNRLIPQTPTLTILSEENGKINIKVDTTSHYKSLSLIKWRIFNPMKHTVRKCAFVDPTISPGGTISISSNDRFDLMVQSLGNG